MMNVRVKFPQAGVYILFLLFSGNARKRRPGTSLNCRKTSLEERNDRFCTDRILAFQSIKPLDTTPLRKPGGAAH